MKAAYGREIDVSKLAPRLGEIAGALNRGDLGRAMIAAVQLRLPELNWAGAVGIARADEALTKYDPDEPRDERGRWTAGAGSGASGPAAANTSAPAVNVRPSRRSNFGSPGSNTSWGRPAPRDGGRFIPVADEEPNLGIGGNGPPPDAELIPEPEPNPRTSQVPPSWDIPSQTMGGAYDPATRAPLLPDGSPWPIATHDFILSVLARQPGTTPSMVLFVPSDGVGPVLVGSTATADYRKPDGYGAVTLKGTPQVTYSGGIETAHAWDSVMEALRLARTNEFSIIYFNRSIFVATEETVVSLIRPDVFAVARPELDLPHIYFPYEVFSPGQNWEDRQDEMPDVPGIAPLRGHHYKRARRFSPEYCKQLGVRYLCS
jgi:hypothetical protein